MATDFSDKVVGFTWAELSELRDLIERRYWRYVNRIARSTKKSRETAERLARDSYPEIFNLRLKLGFDEEEERELRERALRGSGAQNLGVEPWGDEEER